MRTFAAILATVAALAIAETCILKNDELGYTYDLTRLAGQTFSVHDDRNNEGTSLAWEYYFAMCGQLGPEVQPSTPRTQFHAMCARTEGSDGTYMSGPTAAFQLGLDHSGCHRLGGPVLNTSMEVAGPDPAFGVVYKIQGGDKCDAGNGVMKPRSLHVFFECWDDRWNIPDNETVTEDTQCEYHIHVRSTYGCPMECNTEDGHLCGGHGFCGYDPKGKRARCFCNDGRGGEVCEEEVPIGSYKKTSHHGGKVAGGFFGGLFLGAAIGAALYWFVLRQYETGALPFIGGGGGGSSSAYAGFHDDGGEVTSDYVAPPEMPAEEEHSGTLLS
jgi:hypothetical protein